MAKANESRKVIKLNEISEKVSKRGRKTTVTAQDIETAKGLEIGEGFEIEEYNLNGPAFAQYKSERISKYVETPEENVLNAWNSRFRQRIAAISKASGVDLSPVFTKDGELFAGRNS
jgi:hypothetical protein